MSGKFMNIKRIIIPTITMVIIASQLMGCAAASQNELLQMINQGGEAIEIEVAAPLNQEEGTPEAITWEQLALLETNETLRKEWDDLLGITVTDTGKNGMLYVDVNGDNVNNNTLRVALHNRAFSTLLNDENSRLELSNAVLNEYADIEADETEKAIYMGINGYFNLLPDATPNYSNPESTLNRLEFMSMVMRAETPVSDITPDSNFANAVGTNDLNIYAQEVAENSYLDLASKSLNNMTANGTITRGEAVYLLMSRYFADELATLDISKANLSDAKDGDNLIEKAQSQSKEDITGKDYLKSNVLTYVITNPDQGVPTDLYKALVLAESKGIIDSETRFDEGITKAEAVEMLVETLMQETGIASFNFKQGTVEGYEAPVEEVNSTSGGSMTGDEIEEGDEYTDSIIKEEEEAEAIDEELNESTGIEIIEELDKDMYAQTRCNARSGDGTNYNKVASVERSAKVHVTGLTANNWYRVTWGEEEVYISASLLGLEKPANQTSNTEKSNETTEAQPQTQPQTQPSTPSNNSGSGTVPGGYTRPGTSYSSGFTGPISDDNSGWSGTSDKW